MATDSDRIPTEDPELAQKNQRVNRLIGLSLLSALALVLTLIGADVVLIQAAQRPTPRPIVQKRVVQLSGSAANVLGTVYLSVSPGIKPGPDRQLHDAYSVTNFNVRAGQQVKLVIDNTDSTKHSITSPSAGVNIVVKPGTHTYTLLVHRTGIFRWYCNFPCDPYSMTHTGYMRGTITSI